MKEHRIQSVPEKRSVMPIEAIPDWEQRLARQDAFWRNEVLDRPVVFLSWQSELRPPVAVPGDYACFRDYWMDTDRVVRQALDTVAHTIYAGDALPIAWPNLGPEVFSAFWGMEMEYQAETAYGIPNLTDWAQADALRCDRENPYFQKVVEMTDALLAAGEGKFYTGITDLHTGGDCVAAFRDPQTLNLDLLLYPEEVKTLLRRVDAAFFKTLDFFNERLNAARQPCVSWAGIASRYHWHIPSNDFSCMISDSMFEEFFLPGIREECRRTEAAIYHLDGPNALRFLDRLLEIPELNAIQWVYGEGNGRASDWIPVYQRCQAAGKGVQIFAQADEVSLLTEALHPEGVWLAVTVPDVDIADSVLTIVSKWT